MRMFISCYYKCCNNFINIIRMMENDGKKDAPINQSMVEQCRQQCVQNGKNKNELTLFTVYCVGVYCTICSAKNE